MRNRITAGVLALLVLVVAGCSDGGGTPETAPKLVAPTVDQLNPVVDGGGGSCADSLAHQSGSTFQIFLCTAPYADSARFRIFVGAFSEYEGNWNLNSTTFYNEDIAAEIGFQMMNHVYEYLETYAPDPIH